MKKKSFTNGSPDYILIGVIISLLVIGVVMVYSSSFVWAEYKFNDAWFYVKRQLLFAGAGVGAMIFTMNLPLSACL